MKLLKKYAFSIFMLLALIIGSLLGLFASDGFVEGISPLGDIFVNLMFTLVVPLVFFTIVSSIANMDKKAKLSKILYKTILIFIITSLISSIIALIGVFIVNPASNIPPVDGEPGKSVGFLQSLSEAITVTDFFNLLSKSHMLALIIFAIIFGICLRLVDKNNKIGPGLEIISNALLKFVKIVMFYAPIGVMAYFATLVKSFGGEVVTSYLKSFVIYIVIAIVYFIVFYTLYAFLAGGKNGVKNFYRHIFKSFVTSLATQSSLASLPSNIEVADDMNIDKTVSKVALPLGSTIHMEGSSIASILKIFFLFGVFGMPINVGSCLMAVLIAVLSGVVMSGIPGGGLIGEMLIVSLYGFPASAFTMIATIGWIVDAPATAINVCGDIPSTMLIEKFLNRRMRGLKHCKNKELPPQQQTTENIEDPNLQDNKPIEDLEGTIENVNTNTEGDAIIDNDNAINESDMEKATK